MFMDILRCQNCNRKLEENDSIRVNSSDYIKNFAGIKNGEILVCDNCYNLCEKRKDDLKKFLELKNDKKVLVAGPGTGKTFSFLRYLEKFDEGNKIRIVTFINNLVNDLEREINEEFQRNNNLKIKRENVKVSTFHSFCRELVLGCRDKYYFNNLFDLILYDIFKRINNKEKKELKKILDNLSVSNNLFNYFFKASNYYNAVGDSNVVQALLLLIKNREIDVNTLDFEEIIIDEFQDFNKAEYEVIKEFLKSNKKVLIAGDDDQSLYIKLKNTKPDFIREIYEKQDFDKATLRCCNRCTEAITKSVNFFINQVTSRGLLKGRISKEYNCYYPDKYLDCQKYPKIFLYKKKISQTGEKLILDILDFYVRQEEINKGKLNFIIINPSTRKNALEEIRESIENDENFNVVSKKENKKIVLEDGYSFLKKDNYSNLGWRIVLHCDDCDYAIKIKKDMKRLIDNNINLYDELDPDYLCKHLEKANNLQLKEVLEEECEHVEDRPNILFTNFMGSKGLTADHVLLLNIQDGAIPQNRFKIEEEELFNFIVGISRGRKSLHVISQNSWGGKSLFIEMLPEDCCKRIESKDDLGDQLCEFLERQ